MKLTFKDKYTDLSDKEIVAMILAEPHDDEAAAYLIYDRYEPLCLAICQKALDGVHRLDELQSELFMLLKGRRGDWHALRSFGWRSTFGRWLSITAYNLALDLRRQLVENEGRNTSLDDGWTDPGSEARPLEISFDEEQQRERRYSILLLCEVIHTLKNPDQQFVVAHRLRGYSSKEVAQMLRDLWAEQGIVRYNNRGQVVVPDSGYIDNLFKRGYCKVTELYESLNR